MAAVQRVGPDCRRALTALARPGAHGLPGREPGGGESRQSITRPVPLRHNPRPVTDNKRLSEYRDERDPEVFWAAIRPVDEPLRHRWFLPTVVVILIVSVPWYLPPSVGDRLAGGLPVWTWITILCGLALAGVTAFASLRLWRDGSDEAGSEARDGGTVADEKDAT